MHALWRHYCSKDTVLLLRYHPTTVENVKYKLSKLEILVV